MTESLRSTGAPLIYMAAAVALFLSIKAIPRIRLAAKGHVLAVVALVLAVVGAVLEVGIADAAGLSGALIAGGAVGALLVGRVSASAAPSRVAWIPGLTGIAICLGAAGALTSAKLAGGYVSPANLVGGYKVAALAAAGLGAVSGLWGIVLSLKGSSATKATASAAMVVALAGWGAALLGFALANLMMLVAGGVLGTAGLALGRIVAASAGRTLGATLFGNESPDPYGYTNVRACGTEEAATVLETARTVVIVPGFGMAAAGAQHPAKELSELLEKRGAKVLVAVHPSAGAVPGHMNIALDEANVPHDRLVGLAEAQRLVADVDAVLTVGAHDIIDAEAARDPKNPLFGLDALDLSAARSVFVIKRSLRPGAAGVKNPLYDRPNTLMIFGNPKKVVQALLVELKGGGH